MSGNLKASIEHLAEQMKMEGPEAAREALNNLSEEEQYEFRQALGLRVGKPSQRTSNAVWLIVVSSFALVMIGAASVLGTSVFSAPSTGGTKPDIILTVFTTVTAFLAGLFAPSPVAK